MKNIWSRSGVAAHGAREEVRESDLRRTIAEHADIYLAFMIILMGALLAAVGYIVHLNLLIGLGTGFIISVTLTLTIGRLAKEDIVSVVENGLIKVNNSVDSATKASLRNVSVMNGAIEGGITNLYGSRHENQRAERDILSMFEAACEKQEEIFMVTVAAPGIFNTGKLCGKFIENHETPINMTVVLLCPEGSWAKIRSDAEYRHPTLDDIRASIKFLKRNDIKYYLLDAPSFVFLLGTEKTVFIQPYPFTDAETLKEIDPNLAGWAIGGKCPMIQIRSGTTGHQLWLSHYKYLLKMAKANHHIGIWESRNCLEEPEAAVT